MEDKSYYETHLYNLNKFQDVKSQKLYYETIDFNKTIEKDSDAEIISQLKKFYDMPFKKEEAEEEESFTYIDKKGDEKVSIPKLASHLIWNYNFKTIFNSKSESIYHYNKGVYQNGGKGLIKSQVEELLDYKTTIRIVNEVLEKIKRKTVIDQYEFDKTPINLICLENGLYNIETKKLEKFNSDYYFKKNIPIKYDATADCPKIKDFFESTLYPEDVPVIQELFGFCLFRRYFIKKAMILFGEKNTGKTVLLNILIKFMGQHNVAGINLQRISAGDKFGLASLKDKSCNVFDDLSASDLSDAGGFKIATGGGYITAEHKFGDPFQFLNHAKHIFATNKIPNVKDIEDDAYYERWIPIQLDNQVPKEDQDNFLFEKLTTEEEMSGLFNWAIEGLHRLLKKGSFSFNKNSKEIKTIMQRQNNPLVAFVEDALEQQDGNKISKEIMFRAYSKYCKAHKFPRMSKSQLGRNLEMYAQYVLAKHSSKERFWENVKIKGEWGNVLDTYDTLF